MSRVDGCLGRAAVVVSKSDTPYFSCYAQPTALGAAAAAAAAGATLMPLGNFFFISMQIFSTAVWMSSTAG